MKLYYLPGACSLAVHIVLEEAGLPYEAHEIDRSTRKTAAGESLDELNPKGYVPVLVLDDGEILTEGPAINQYLADLVPDKELAPPVATRDRVRLQAWLNFISTELHKSFGPFFQGAPEEWLKVLRERIDNRLAYVDKELQGREWLTGKHFSIADAYLFVVVSWARKMEMPLARFANLNALMERIAARPAVQAALKAEGLS